MKLKLVLLLMLVAGVCYGQFPVTVTSETLKCGICEGTTTYWYDDVDVPDTWLSYDGNSPYMGNRYEKYREAGFGLELGGGLVYLSQEFHTQCFKEYMIWLLDLYKKELL